jgi:putative inorganic carbon (HCO3(-)) transporter
MKTRFCKIVTQMKKKANHWFDWVQIIVLVVFSPLFIFPRPQLWWIILIIPLLWMVRKIVEKQFVAPTMVNVPIFIFLLAVLISTLRVPDFSHSLGKFAGVLFAIAFFYAAADVLKTGKLLKWAVNLFLLGGFLFSLIGLLGMPTFKGKHLDILMKIKDKIPRIDFGLPGAELGFSTNAVGGTLLLVIPLFFVIGAAAWLDQNKKDAVLPVIGLAVTGGVLLLTQSRGAWVSLFISTVIIGLLLLVKIMKKKKIYLIVVTGLLVLAIIVGIGVYSMAHSDQLQPGIKQAEGTLLFRIQLWNLAIPIVKANPMCGIGLNNFRTEPEVRYFLSSAHNQFLHIAVELGIPALIAYLAILLIMGYMCVQVWEKSPAAWMRIAALGLGWGQLAFLFFGLTDAIPPGAKVGILFWISLALISVLYQFNRRNTEQKKQ